MRTYNKVAGEDAAVGERCAGRRGVESTDWKDNTGPEHGIDALLLKAAGHERVQIIVNCKKKGEMSDSFCKVEWEWERTLVHELLARMEDGDLLVRVELTDVECDLDADGASADDEDAWVAGVVSVCVDWDMLRPVGIAEEWASKM